MCIHFRAYLLADKKVGQIVVCIALLGIFLLIGCRGRVSDPGSMFNTDHYGDASYMYSDDILKHVIEKNQEFTVISVPNNLNNSGSVPAGDLNELLDTVWYVPLETTNLSAIGSINKVRVYKGHIYIMDLQTGLLLMFDSKGAFVRVIGARGRGPTEYLGLNYFEIIDDEIALVDGAGKKVIYYTLEGEFLHELDFPLRVSSFYPLNDEIIVADIDGNANFHLPQIVESKIVFFDRSWRIVGQAFPYDPLAEAGTSFYFRSVFKDTPGGLLYNPTFDYHIYSFGEGRLFKKYYVDVGDNKLKEGFRKGLSQEQFLQDYSPFTSYFTNYFETDRHVALTLYINNRQTVVYYSKISGRIIAASHLLPSPLLPYLNRPIGLYDNNFIMMLAARELRALAEQLKNDPASPTFSPDIMTLFKNADLHDNPILVFYRLKSF